MTDPSTTSDPKINDEELERRVQALKEQRETTNPEEENPSVEQREISSELEALERLIREIEVKGAERKVESEEREKRGEEYEEVDEGELSEQLPVYREDDGEMGEVRGYDDKAGEDSGEIGMEEGGEAVDSSSDESKSEEDKDSGLFYWTDGHDLWLGTQRLGRVQHFHDQGGACWVMAEGGMDNEGEVRAQRAVGEARREVRERRREERWRQARFDAQRAHLEDLRERIRRAQEERRAAYDRVQGRTLFRIGGWHANRGRGLDDEIRIHVGNDMREINRELHRDMENMRRDLEDAMAEMRRGMRGW
jgi:hypothetical protein